VVVGLDLSLTATGFARRSDNGTALATIRSSPGPPTEARLLAIEKNVLDRIPQTTQLVVIEGSSYNSDTGKPSERDGLQWIIRTGLYVAKIRILMVEPARLKKFILGKTKRVDDTKAMLLQSVRAAYGIAANNDNEADAAALAILGAAYLGQIAPQTPAQREVLDQLRAGPTPKKRKPKPRKKATA
jgi:hypothetical protein